MMKCSNCGGTEFENMQLFNIQLVEGYAAQLVQACVCLDCGKVELFMPQEILKKARAEAHAKKEAEAKQFLLEEQRAHETENLPARMHELENIVTDENRTLKELKAAQRELTEIQDKLGIRVR